MSALLPGSTTLGVLGGGQLGRMFVHAAQRLGYRCMVVDPDADSPAGRVAEHHLRSDYLDAHALDALASQAQAVTIEFENVPAEALRRLAEHLPVAPGAAAVAVCQDRALEKATFARCDVPCAPHALIDGEAAIAKVGDDLLPGILKTAQMGYDGKGQRRVDSRDELIAAWRTMGGLRCVLERRLDLACEISVVLVRGVDGGMVKNDWMLQFLADILGLPVERPRVPETTALGAAFLAGLGAGLYRTLDEIAAAWQRDRRFDPAMKPVDRNALVARWRKLVARVREI